MTKQPFETILRSKSREDAHTAQAKNGSIRQLRNAQARTLLNKYVQDGDCPSIENASFMKQKTDQSQQGMKSFLDIIQRETQNLVTEKPKAAAN